MKKKTKALMAALAAILAVAMIGGCTAMAGGGERPDDRTGQEGSGEHGPGGENGSENGGEGGEEGGTRLTKDETFDEVRKGARLKMRYEAAQQAFIGTGDEYHQRDAAGGAGGGPPVQPRRRARPADAGGSGARNGHARGPARDRTDVHILDRTPGGGAAVRRRRTRPRRRRRRELSRPRTPIRYGIADGRGSQGSRPFFGSLGHL